MNNKFRVWCKNKNQWETDYCVLTSDGVLLHRVRNTWVPLNKDTHIIQFGTGLEDKNGKEIFEGDIVFAIATYDCANMVVVWDDGGFVLVPCKYYKNYISRCGYKDIRFLDKEVVGNIFESENLLEVANGQH